MSDAQSRVVDGATVALAGRRRLRLALGVVLLAAAAFVSSRNASDERLPTEPLARALAPLGPIKAIASAALWTRLDREQKRGESREIELLARALLELHPGFDDVREYLAYQLIASEARRTSDPRRKDAIVDAGLELLEQGLDLHDSARLHSALGQLIVARRDRDPGFALAVERRYGDTPTEIAIEHLRHADAEDTFDMMVLGRLLVERGLRSLFTDRAVRAARRDLSEAERRLASVRAESPREALLIVTPLRDVLARLEAGADIRDLDPLYDDWQDARRADEIGTPDFDEDQEDDA